MQFIVKRDPQGLAYVEALPLPPVPSAAEVAKKARDEAQRVREVSLPDPKSCPTCGFTAASEWGLKVHIRAKHPDVGA